MMDSNSKLSKSLGYTAKGFEGFRAVLEKAKNEGWDTEKVFGVITQRATAAFTTFQNGVETLDNFKNGLENVGDIMQDQTNVQLGSLTNQAKLTKEAFHNLWLTIDNGEGVLAKTGKAFMAFLRLLVRGEGLKSDFIETLDKQIYSLGETIRLATAQAPQSVAYLTAIRDQLIKNRAIIDKNTEDWFQLNATYYKQNAEKASEAISATILKMAETQVKAFKDAVKQGGEVEAQFKRFTTMFTTLRDNEKEGSQQQLVYIKTLELLDKEDKTTKKINDDYFMKAAEPLVGKEAAVKKLNQTKLSYYEQNSNFPEYEKAALDYYKNFDTFDPNELLRAAWIFADHVKTPASLKKATEWAEKSVMRSETSENTYILAKLYHLTGNKEMAKNYAEMSRNMAVQGNKDSQLADELLKQIK